MLGRDLPEIGHVKLDHSKLAQLLGVLAARTSGLVNHSVLGRDLALDDKTVKAHIALLTQLFLLYRLSPWSANLGARQVKTPKLLLADSGMAAAIIGADAARYGAHDQGTLAGMLLETFVVMEIVKQATWSQQAVELYLYRDTEKREVDIVIESSSGDVAAVETKATAGVTSSDIRGLELLRAKLGSRFKAGVVIYSGEHTLKLSDRVWAVPLPGLWR